MSTTGAEYVRPGIAIRPITQYGDGRYVEVPFATAHAAGIQAIQGFVAGAVFGALLLSVVLVIVRGSKHP